MRTLSVLVPCVLLAACGSASGNSGTVTQPQATQGFTDASGNMSAALTTAASQAVQQASPGGPVSLNYTYDCSGGGTLLLTGQITPNSDGIDAFDVSAEYSGCNSGDGTAISGNMTWQGNVTSVSAGEQETFTWTGDLSFSGSTDGTCSLDVTGQATVGANESVTALNYSGTICGYAASSILGSNS